MSVLYSQQTNPNQTDASQPDIPCNVRFARMLDRDYVYVVSDTEVTPDQALREVIGFMSEDILLDQDSTRIVTTHLDEESSRIYRMFDIFWGPNGARLAPIEIRSGANPAEFLETLLACSISVASDEI